MSNVPISSRIYDVDWNFSYYVICIFFNFKIIYQSWQQSDAIWSWFILGFLSLKPTGRKLLNCIAACFFLGGGGYFCFLFYDRLTPNGNFKFFLHALNTLRALSMTDSKRKVAIGYCGASHTAIKMQKKHYSTLWFLSSFGFGNSTTTVSPVKISGTILNVWFRTIVGFRNRKGAQTCLKITRVCL